MLIIVFTYFSEPTKKYYLSSLVIQRNMDELILYVSICEIVVLTKSTKFVSWQLYRRILIQMSKFKIGLFS